MSRLSSNELLAGIAAGETNLSARALLLAAHPDDETIGASAFLGRSSDSTVIFLTDGAPRDQKLRSPHVSGSREMYALVRAEEAACALALVGVPGSRISFLNTVDQEAIFEIDRLVQQFADAAQRIAPDLVMTHSYEGGHPDHDAAALVAHLGIWELQRRGVRPPHVLEFTSYHAVNGRRVAGEFLPRNVSWQAPQEVRLTLTREERARKARMMGCYLSQWHVLSEFPLEPERVRVAPVYDFTQPPHPGPLWYECLHWPLTGKKWREIAAGLLPEQRAAA